MRIKAPAKKFIIIEGKVYLVLSYEEGVANGFQKGNAYHDESIKLVLPFKGIFQDFDERSPGIYSDRKSKRVRYIFPSVKLPTYKQYKPNNIEESGHNMFAKGDYVKGDIILDSDGEAFKPRIDPEDDMNLKIYKAAFCLKDAPLSAFDNRFQNTDIGTNPSNRKSNAKKAILNNNSLSSTKLVQLADVVDLDVAIILKDKSTAAFPMRTKNRPIVIFSNAPFDYSNAIPLSEFSDDDLYKIETVEGDETI